MRCDLVEEQAAARAHLRDFDCEQQTQRRNRDIPDKPAAWRVAGRSSVCEKNNASKYGWHGCSSGALADIVSKGLLEPQPLRQYAMDEGQDVPRVWFARDMDVAEGYPLTTHTKECGFEFHPWSLKGVSSVCGIGMT